MAYIDMSPKPNFVRPELLTHPQIPKALSGVAPRAIMGQEWWDEARRMVYEQNNHCCWACGDDGVLEAHECYHIDYEHARLIFDELVALCPNCHSFIHLGRAGTLVGRGILTERDFKYIIRTRYALLERNNLKPSWQFYRTLSSLCKSYTISKPLWLQRIMADSTFVPRPPSYVHLWEDWRMVFEGREYPPVYHSEREVREVYEED